MDLSLSEEQLMIQKAAREFAQQQCFIGSYSLSEKKRKNSLL